MLGNSYKNAARQAKNTDKGGRTMTQHDDDFTTLPPRRGEETYTAEQIVKAFIDRTKKFPETREALLATGEFADPSLVKDLEQKLDDTRQKLADTKSDLEVARKDSDRLTLEVAQLKKDKASLESKLAAASVMTSDSLDKIMKARKVVELWSVGEPAVKNDFFAEESEAKAEYDRFKAICDKRHNQVTIKVEHYYFFAKNITDDPVEDADFTRKATKADLDAWKYREEYRELVH